MSWCWWAGAAFGPLVDTLRRTDGNKTAAARILGIGLRTLYRKLELYGEQ